MKFIKDKIAEWKLKHLLSYAKANNIILVKIVVISGREYIKMPDGSLRVLSRR